MDDLQNIYVKSQITQKVKLFIWEMQDNLKEILEYKIKRNIEGKCIIQGYVKKNSVQALQYTNGELIKEFVHFNVIVECDICNPCEGMIIETVVRNITKAGIRCEINDKYSNPIVVFINREFTINLEELNKLNIDDIILVKVIGQRYQLNDEYISVIAELHEKKKEKRERKSILK